MTGILDTLGDLAAGAADTATDALDQATDAASYPGYGSLWTVDAGGFRFTTAGQIILGLAAAYGLSRLMGGR